MERAHDSERSVEGFVDSGNISGWCINGRQIAYIIGNDGVFVVNRDVKPSPAADLLLMGCIM